jgi:anti-anti-sigma factor
MVTSGPDAGRRRDQVAVSLRGELDIVSAPAALAVLAAAAIRGQFVVADLAELDFLDCSAVSLLRYARVVARQSGGDVMLVNSRGSALRILTILDWAGLSTEALSCRMNGSAPVLISARVSSVAKVS